MQLDRNFFNYYIARPKEAPIRAKRAIFSLGKWFFNIVSPNLIRKAEANIRLNPEFSDPAKRKSQEIALEQYKTMIMEKDARLGDWLKSENVKNSYDSDQKRLLMSFVGINLARAVKAAEKKFFEEGFNEGYDQGYEIGYQKGQKERSLTLTY